MGKPAARRGETTHDGDTLEEPPGNPTVLINSRAVWHVADPHACSEHGVEAAVLGSASVRIGGRDVIRQADFLVGASAPNRVDTGSPDVRIGAPVTGIAEPRKVQGFCAGYCALKKDWQNLSPAERKARYEGVVADLFDQFGAPAPQIREGTDAGSAASFSETTWSILVPDGAFDAAEPPSGAATLHESRHGEQFFSGARALATPTAGTPPPTWSDVAEQAHIPAAVASAATRRPIDPDSSDGRFARLMASECYSEGGKAALNKSITDYYDAYARDPKTAYDVYAEGYMKRPVGQDAAELEHLGECGGCQ